MLHIKNFTEELVRQHLDTHLKNADVCHCEGCRLDIMAIMLNSLKPHYVVSDAGALYAQLQQLSSQYAVDLSISMVEAIRIVKEKPRHK